MSLTKIASKFFSPRQKELEKHFTEPEQLQRSVLNYLVSKGRDTEYGRSHAFVNIKGYDDFMKSVPINTYEELKGDIDRMRHGESSVLWPGLVRWYAKSSGTTNDKSKFIPVSSAGLHNIHYKGGSDVVALYLRNNPDSRLFDGKSLILGGSHSPNYNVEGSLVGDLSAILIENINPVVNLFRVPKKRTALLSDFELKRDRIASECMGKNVTNISGVPSWMLSVLVRMLELSGKKHVEDVWPDLEVFFHGGIAFEPYRKQYEEIITSRKMHYMETYNASEGFFGIQDDPNDHSMLLMLDYGVFYEFIPMEDVCERTGAQILEYTAAPVYMDENAKCRHQWLIEFSKEPDDMKAFADCLDSKLQEINSDYEAKRFHDVTLQHLEVVKAHPHLFEEWLKAKGKLGGQHKVPRLSNSRKNMDELLELNGNYKGQ